MERNLKSVTTPKQARSQATLTRLLDAAEELFLQNPPQDVSIADIVRRAGSSIGGFYSRFPDKDALLRALQERRLVVVQQMLETIADPERWRDVPLSLMVRGLLQELVRHYTERRRLIAAFVSAAAQNPREWADTVQRRDAMIEVVLRLIVPQHREAIRHPDPERAIRFATHAAFAVMDTYAIRLALDDSVWRDPPELVDELHRMYMGYLEREP
ncbi:MAG: TetR/AcrR family transcriptional regulator [Sandaracinaceae bacterium]|jgi:AcrR family transcriptional regulator|nr:TetR/AcrR family transcriptional regulator [Sandaracinaceae bacterium]MBP7685903.1 TetR/AcrR family transcriptional regulator [Deltaproteobacteria bacterium]MBK6813550.1 TetR/AcrR family transcriptional regulator [Sandaracinaceae bacterium]MBK7152822.1 TetR/AcrR family transcriptional regulator [Sandaracinaceae bacterium]MBK7778914.1 TetR/AcrR family transcriptional regulator [Sandaracinaceae bacterium]